MRPARGQWTPRGRTLPRFVGQALAGEPITVFGDGTQTRTFTHVADAVGALVALADAPRALGEIVNLGGVEEIAIGALAARVKALVGSASPIVHVPYEEAYGEGFEDMPRRVPDITKIRALIGYEPRRGVDDVIADVAGHLRRAAAAPR